MTSPAQIPACTSESQAAKRHLSTEERCQLISMIGGDLNRLAEVLAALGGICSNVEPELNHALDMRDAIMVASRKVRVRANAA